MTRDHDDNVRIHVRQFAWQHDVRDAQVVEFPGDIEQIQRMERVFALEFKRLLAHVGFDARRIAHFRKSRAINEIGAHSFSPSWWLQSKGVPQRRFHPAHWQRANHPVDCNLRDRGKVVCHDD
jgi:hypothetical protein